jgi:hypothetical protein
MFKALLMQLLMFAMTTVVRIGLEVLGRRERGQRLSHEGHLNTI